MKSQSRDLTKKHDRVLLADLAFTYPQELHQRKHGPGGYASYESYRDWLRDEFQYRCIFSLVRETWPGACFHIDHLIPRVERPDWTCRYENLLLLASQLNLVKGKRKIPDPCQYIIADCLYIHLREGIDFGKVKPLNEIGETWEAILRLNSYDAVDARQKWIGILRSVATADESLFRKLIGYPQSLPDLENQKEPENNRPEGKSKCAASLRASGCLPDYY